MVVHMSKLVQVSSDELQSLDFELRDVDRHMKRRERRKEAKMGQFL